MLNPRNDRDVRLSNDFSSPATRGNILSPQIAMPVGVNETRKTSGLLAAQSTQELHSSYQTKHLRRKIHQSFEKTNFSGFGSTAASKAASKI